jgi:alanyl-tRNA synthetase
MTRKIFYENEEQLEFDAKIIEQIQDGKYWKIVLDQTCFYPEGGGQPADKGTIEGKKVLNVKKEEDNIYHFLKEKIEQTKVHCKVDHNWRYDYMQQHTGQHIISGALMKIGNYPTVSVHQGESATTIEIDAPDIPKNDIFKVEELSNEIINLNIPISSHFTDLEGLKHFTLRRPTKATENIRIIQIEDFDTVACGGVHFTRTGKVGLIKWEGMEKIRGRIRLSWKIGNRAIMDYHEKMEIINNLNVIFSSQQHQLIERIQKLQENQFQITGEKMELENQLSEAIKDKLKTQTETINSNNQSINLIYKEFNNFNPNILKKVMEKLLESENTFILFFNHLENRFNWIIAHSMNLSLPIPKQIQELLSHINGKGGGKPPIWQGIGTKAEGIPQLKESLINIIKSN